MTRKHYVLIADAIKENILYDPSNKNNNVNDVDLKGVISSLSWRLKGDNMRFNSERFDSYINEDFTPNV